MADPRPYLVAADGATPLRQQLTREIAAPSMMSARSILTGSPADGLDPERVASILRAAEGGSILEYLELAEAMEERDPHYNAVLGTRKRQVAQLPIAVEAASDDPVDQAKANLVRDFVARDTIEAELFDILDAVGKGFSMTELIWPKTFAGGFWLPERMILRDPRWFEFDRIDGTTPLIRGFGPPQPVPPMKFLAHVHPAKSGLTIRGGLAKPAAWAYLFKSFALKDWVSFAEVYGFPVRLGKYGPGATEEQQRTLLRAVSMISQDAAAIIPDSMSIEFIGASSGATSEVYSQLCQYVDRQLSKLVLGQTATTDSEGGGLGGSGKEHNDVRGDIERADAKLLASTLNRDLVKPIIDLNFAPVPGKPSLYPRLVIGRPPEIDVKARLEAISTYVSMGGRVASSVVRDEIGLPDPADNEPLLSAPGSPEPQTPAVAPREAPGGPATAATRPPHLLWPLRASYPGLWPPVTAADPAAPAPRPAGDDIDALVAVLADEGWREVMGPMVEPLVEALTAATSYEDAIALLAPTLARMDAAALAERLERAAFAVRAAALTGADGTLPDTPAG